MTRIGRDSTVPGDIPVDGRLAVAMGYLNGRYQWPEADDARFTDAGVQLAWIDVTGHAPAADILDIEAGNATDAMAPGWVRAHNGLSTSDYPAILYSNRSNLTPLFNVLNDAGLQVVRDFRLWIATLDGTRQVADMTGVTAVQYAGTAITRGHYDESLIYDPQWKAAPPKPAVTLVSVDVVARYSDGSQRSWKA